MATVSVTPVRPPAEIPSRPGDPPAAPIPRLENGDRLTRREFERRYEAMPHVKGAELVEGIVYMPSPIRAQSHAQPHQNINTWLGLYRVNTPGVLALDTPTLRLDEDNEPQPDALLMVDPALGGRARISTDDYLEGAPELIVEIASSSVSRDLHQKLNVYRRSGVQEYAVWQVLDRRIGWWQLIDGAYLPLAPDEAGILRSAVFPGLWLAAPQLLADDMTAVLDVLQQGLQSPGHAAFAQSLSRPRSIPSA